MKLLPAILLALICTAAYGGSIRYELSALLGEHSYDGGLSLFEAIQQIDTPLGFYAVEEARLVVVGRVSHGQAHGDGVIRENTTFELLPSVSVYPSFVNSIELNTESTSEAFRLEFVYANPFVPAPIPLPGPDGSPPVSFSVYLSVRPSLETEFPPLIDPSGDTLSDGIVVTVPIITNIEHAYIVLSGASIVPEPSGFALVCGSILVLASTRYQCP